LGLLGFFIFVRNTLPVTILAAATFIRVARLSTPTLFCGLRSLQPSPPNKTDAINTCLISKAASGCGTASRRCEAVHCIFKESGKADAGIDSIDWCASGTDSFIDTALNN
jgi:hypothetical protein